jgi:hypothetical protein
VSPSTLCCRPVSYGTEGMHTLPVLHRYEIATAKAYLKNGDAQKSARPSIASTHSGQKAK